METMESSLSGVTTPTTALQYLLLAVPSRAAVLAVNKGLITAGWRAVCSAEEAALWSCSLTTQGDDISIFIFCGLRATSPLEYEAPGFQEMYFSMFRIGFKELNSHVV